MGRILAGLVLAGIVLIAAGWALTLPARVPGAEIAALTPDPARGEMVFHAAGCASCHIAPGASRDDPVILSGGKSFDTPAGTFYAPNVSMDPDAGIGAWSAGDIVTAVMKGTSPDGRHYYPSFPYPSYGKADLQDIVDLAAFIRTLPADPTPSRAHDLPFPYSIRAGLGLWKLANVTDAWAVSIPDDPILARGRYLSEALGHCGECHTPRTALQGLDLSRWFAGAPNPSGRGRIPNINTGGLDWSEADIAAYLTDGFTPTFDVVGGSMAAVVAGLSKLPQEDRDAIAAYLKITHPVP